MTTASMSSFDPASLRILERLDEIQSQLLQSLEANTLPRPQPSSNATPALRPHHRRPSLPGNIEAILDWPAVRPYWDAIPVHTMNTCPGSTDIASSRSILSTDLDFVTCNHLLDNFFSFVHIKNPVLDENQTRRMVKRVFAEGIGWDQDSCLALIICANGAIARSFFAESMSAAEVKASHGPVLYQAAQKRLGIVMANHGLVAAQCLFLFGVYRMCMLQPHDAWRMFLQALAACQQFKFVTGISDTSKPSEMTHAEECIYWSCWKSERELRWVLKLPDFGELANDHPKLFPSLPEGLCDGEQLSAWYFYLSEISLWRLSTKARRDMENFEPAADVPFLEGLAELSEELKEKAIEWSQSLAPAVKLELVSSHEESEVLRFILRGHVTSYYEAIWWPFVDAVVNHDNTSHTVLSCASRGLEVHLRCLEINQPGFRYRHHGTWLLQQSCIRSVLVLLAASKRETAARLLPSGWETAVRATIQLLIDGNRQDGGLSDSIVTLLGKMSST
jgi:hypothetical protein